jgi:AraC-like DNA-binding protein
MDLHIIPGVKAKDVANAHLLDIMIQKEHNCKCMTYWIDESRGHVFCLIDAPGKDVVTELHNKAHGLVPHKIIEVQASLVESFLGRVSDPEETELTDDGLKLLKDPSFRVLLVLKMADPVLLQCHHGKEKTNKLLNTFHEVIRQQLARHGGIEAEHEGPTRIASFTSAARAVDCAMNIHAKLAAIHEFDGFRIAVNGGEPVTKNEHLFGDTIQLAERMCFIAKDRQVSITTAVKQMAFKDHSQNTTAFMTLGLQEEQLLGSLFQALEENWQDGDFNLDYYCQAMAMSRSQLYRKTLALSGFSPNVLLKEFRLEKGKALLQMKPHNISELSFNAGFSSPSYFTKCFKKKYGVLPMAYLDMLHQA